ncbi:MAG: roadblock/LC7 domain-containing protein [Longimicrobiales bacterium]
MSAFEAELLRLSSIHGVRGAMVVDLQAGVPVASELSGDVDGVAVAALAASLFQRSRSAVQAPALGELRTARLESEAAQLIMVASGELIVVVVAEANAQIGMVRVEAKGIAEGLT